MVCIWADKDFENYTPEQKLVFLYLCTNPLTRESGIYQATLKTISDATGVSRKGLPTVLNVLKNIYYDFINEIVFVKNFYRFNGQGGRPDKIVLSILADIDKYHTPLWHEFLKAYPDINFEISNTITNTNTNTNTIDGFVNPLQTVSGMDGKDKVPKELVYTADFVKFWDSYSGPNKTPNAKASCYKLWKSLSDIDRAEAVAKLPAYIANASEPKYIAKPSKYLTEKLWQADFKNPTAGVLHATLPPGYKKVDYSDPNYDRTVSPEEKEWLAKKELEKDKK